EKEKKKSLQKKFTRPMPTLLVFPKELLLELDDDDDNGEETIAKNKTTKQEGEVEKIESVYVESDKDDEDVTQATAPVSTTTTLTTAPMTEQERAVHQLINDLMESDTDKEEEMPINQLK
ncbi:hypothetical protein J1N35_005527, partial [Gossypium stocksii]